MKTKGKKSGKKVFILKRSVYGYAAAAVAVFILLLFVLFSIDGKQELSLYYSPSQNGAVVLSSDKVFRKIIPGKSVARVRYCAEKTSCAVLMSEGSSYTLYSVSDDGFDKISANCTSDYVMSGNGESVVYITEDGYLCNYSVKTGKTATIDENTVSFAVSSNGKTVLYSKSEGNAAKLYLSVNGNVTHVADNYSPLAVSDDASIIYVISSDNSLYLLGTDGAVKSKLCSSVDAGMFCLSNDMRSIVFNDNSYTYISVGGKSRVRLIPGKAVPAFTASQSSLCNSSGMVYVYPKKKLTDMIYVNADGVQNYSLYFVDKNMTRTDISDAVVDYTITDNNSVVYLKTNGEVYLFEKGKSTLTVNGAANMHASSDGRYTYYLTDDAKLYVNYNDTETLIANGVSKMYMADDDRLYFIMSDGVLYSIKRKKRSEIIDENVYSCRCVGSAAYYSKNYSMQTGTFELFGADNSEKFHFLADGLTRI